MKSYKENLKLDLTMYKGKKFNVITDFVRHCIRNEHGYRATKYLSNETLSACRFSIRFKTGNEINISRTNLKHRSFKPIIIY